MPSITIDMIGLIVQIQPPVLSVPGVLQRAVAVNGEHPPARPVGWAGGFEPHQVFITADDTVLGELSARLGLPTTLVFPVTGPQVPGMLLSGWGITIADPVPDQLFTSQAPVLPQLVTWYPEMELLPTVGSPTPLAAPQVSVFVDMTAGQTQAIQFRDGGGYHMRWIVQTIDQPTVNFQPAAGDPIGVTLADGASFTINNLTVNQSDDYYDFGLNFLLAVGGIPPWDVLNPPPVDIEQDGTSTSCSVTTYP
jgi:hypothetical protein